MSVERTPAQIEADYEAWADDPNGEPWGGSPLTDDEVMAMIQEGIDELDRGEYMTAEQMRIDLGLPPRSSSVR